MGKIKVHELAKELNLDNKEIMDIANKVGVSITSHLNAIDSKEAEKRKKR